MRHYSRLYVRHTCYPINVSHFLKHSELCVGFTRHTVLSETYAVLLMEEAVSPWPHIKERSITARKILSVSTGIVAKGEDLVLDHTITRRLILHKVRMIRACQDAKDRDYPADAVMSNIVPFAAAAFEDAAAEMTLPLGSAINISESNNRTEELAPILTRNLCRKLKHNVSTSLKHPRPT